MANMDSFEKAKKNVKIAGMKNATAKINSKPVDLMKQFNAREMFAKTTEK